MFQHLGGTMSCVPGYSEAEVELAHQRLTRAIHQGDERIAAYRIVRWGPSDGYEAIVVDVPEHAAALQRVLTTSFSPDDPDLYRVEVNAEPVPEEYLAGRGIFIRTLDVDSLPADVVDDLERASEEFQRARESGAPIQIVGWDEENQYWAVVREGESSFTGVQDLGDAISASSTRGDVPVIVSDEVYEQMVRKRDAWLPRPARVRASPPA